MDTGKTGREVRVVMVGGGHANVQVMRFLAERLSSLIVRPSPSSSSSSSREEGRERKGVRMVMVSDQEKAFYSGMLPGALAGLYSPSQISIDLPSLCLWSVPFLSSLFSLLSSLSLLLLCCVVL